MAVPHSTTHESQIPNVQPFSDAPHNTLTLAPTDRSATPAPPRRGALRLVGVEALGDGVLRDRRRPLWPGLASEELAPDAVCRARERAGFASVCIMVCVCGPQSVCVGAVLLRDGAAGHRATMGTGGNRPQYSQGVSRGVSSPR